MSSGVYISLGGAGIPCSLSFRGSQVLPISRHLSIFIALKSVRSLCCPLKGRKVLGLQCSPVMPVPGEGDTGQLHEVSLSYRKGIMSQRNRKVVTSRKCPPSFLTPFLTLSPSLELNPGPRANLKVPAQPTKCSPVSCFFLMFFFFSSDMNSLGPLQILDFGPYCISFLCFWNY